MDEQIQRLEHRVAQQDERIAQLERRLGRSSRNSSQPPSQDPPSAGLKRGKDPSGRARGAQPGHEGRGRGLLPASAVDEVIDHWPAECGCGRVFCAADRVAAGEPARHQVEELPVMAVRVIEHRAQRVRCPACGARRTATLPAEVAQSAFGARLQAAVATLSVRNRVSRRDVVELCEQLFSARISTGSVEAILQRAGDALQEPYEDLLEEVRLAAALNMDETGRAGIEKPWWMLRSLWRRAAVLDGKAAGCRRRPLASSSSSACVTSSDCKALWFGPGPCEVGKGNYQCSGEFYSPRSLVHVDCHCYPEICEMASVRVCACDTGECSCDCHYTWCCP